MACLGVHSIYDTVQKEEYDGIPSVFFFFFIFKHQVLTYSFTEAELMMYIKTVAGKIYSYRSTETFSILTP